MRFAMARRRGATRRQRSAPGRWKFVLGPPLQVFGVVLVLAGLGAGAGLGARALQDPAAFPLRHARIEGERRNLSEADLQALVGPYLGQNFFMVNLDALRATLAAQPWVEDVAVRRGWPDVLAIELRERVAFGYWGEREMVDVRGRRFQPAQVRQPGPWPRLAGPAGHEQALIQTWREVQALFEPVGLHLATLFQDERRAWWLTFDNGLEVYVGREQFAPRLHRLAQFYPQVLAAQIERIAAVDLRYGHGFAVRWKAGPPAPAPAAGSPIGRREGA